MRKILFLLSLSFSLPAHANEEAPLLQLEAHCWASAVENGSFLCQHLMLMGKVEGHGGWQIPELYAPDSEEKRKHQADLACEILGFRYARGYELGHSEKETLMARLEPSASWVFRSKGAYIKHLLCD